MGLQVEHVVELEQLEHPVRQGSHYKLVQLRKYSGLQESQCEVLSEQVRHLK